MIKFRSGKVKLEAWMIILVIIIVGLSIYKVYEPKTSVVEKGDTIPPIVNIIEPVSGSVVSNEVKIKIEAKDDMSGVSNVEVHIGPLYTVNAEPIREHNIYVYYWDTHGTPNGNCEIRIKAYDYDNNVGEASITVRVKNQLII